MQVMPAAAADMSNWNHLFDEPPTAQELEIPEVGILIGAHYLKWLLSLPQINGNLQKAIGLYNAGPNTFVDPKTKEETTAEEKLLYWQQPKDAMARGFDYLKLFLGTGFGEDYPPAMGGVGKSQGQFTITDRMAGSEPSLDVGRHPPFRPRPKPFFPPKLIEQPGKQRTVLPVPLEGGTQTSGSALPALQLGNHPGNNIVAVSPLVESFDGSKVSANVNPVLEQIAAEWDNTESQYTFTLSEGHRGPEAQAALDPKVTKAKAGESQHQTGYAFDIYFFDAKGNMVNSAVYDKEGNLVKPAHPELQNLHAKFLEMGRQHGLVKPLTWDTPHYVSAQTLFADVAQTVGATEQGAQLLQMLGPKIQNGTITNSELNALMMLAFGGTKP